MASTEKKSILLLALLTVLLSGFAQTASAQDRSKDIKSEEVMWRPTAGAANVPGGGTTPVERKARNVSYRSSRPFTKARTATTEYSQVGVTVWRLKDEGGAKQLEQKGNEAQLEQVESGAALKIGSSVRIGIEPLTHDGYLYVIDREQFADGTFGAARLIFPTLRTRKGNNRVRTNQLVLIPGPPSYFQINPSTTGKQQVAEVLTIILSPTALNLPEPLSEKPMSIDDALFKNWERRWLAPLNVLEMNGGAGSTISVKAQVEGVKSLDQQGEERQQLTGDDPYPQTIYRALIRRGNPLLVTASLRFAAAGAN